MSSDEQKTESDERNGKSGEKSAVAQPDVDAMAKEASDSELNTKQDNDSTGEAKEDPATQPKETSAPHQEPSTKDDKDDKDEATTQRAVDEEKPKSRSSWKKRLAWTTASLPVLLMVGWFAVHNIPGFGPLVADTLRAVFGKAFVAWLEDTAYGVQDWFNRKTKSGQEAKSPWAVPAGASATTAPSAQATASSSASAAAKEKAKLPPFSLPPVGPMYKKLATTGEGVWLPLVDPRKPNDRVRLLKTFLHPDKNRSWAMMVIVAVDTQHVQLRAVAGSHEPKAKTTEGKAYKRTGIIPKGEFGALIAAFNGGYKATHGDYGMKVDGILLAPGRPLACTIARYNDGRYGIQRWKDVKKQTGDMLWFRQTPVCMYDRGKPHPGLSMPKLGWGASVVSGTTVIRRSAMGISKDGKVLYVGLGNFVTGRTIAEAMVHAGSHSVAQLDVNFSFPKFLTYKHKSPEDKELVAVPLTKNFEFHEQQYVGRRSHRDFFYLVRKPKTP